MGERWAGGLLLWQVSAHRRAELAAPPPPHSGVPTLPLSSVRIFFWLGAWNGSS